MIFTILFNSAFYSFFVKFVQTEKNFVVGRNIASKNFLFIFDPKQNSYLKVLFPTKLFLLNWMAVKLNSFPCYQLYRCWLFAFPNPFISNLLALHTSIFSLVKYNQENSVFWWEMFVTEQNERGRTSSMPMSALRLDVEKVQGLWSGYWRFNNLVLLPN